ncbi:O-antigen ligase family protein [Elusimicrobiota bacterium]
MKLNIDKIYNNLLNWGVVILALSITFSISLMNTSFCLLFIALLIKLFRKKAKFIPTGLEIPLLIFIFFHLVSAVVSPNPSESINDVCGNYWYVLHMYLVIYLFGEREISKFVKILAWSAVGISIYTILQSSIGLNLRLEMNIKETVEMVAPKLEKVTEIAGFNIYEGTGVMGHHLTFGGQIMMLVFIVYAALKKKWFSLLAFIAMMLSFAYSAWVGFISIMMLYFLIKRKQAVFAAVIIIVFAVLLSAVPGNRKKIKEKFDDRVNIWKTSLDIYSRSMLFGVGAGQYSNIFDKEYSAEYTGSKGGARTHPHSIYLDMLTESGILTFIAFLFFLFRFISMYVRSPEEDRWKGLHMACALALGAMLIAGVFQTYITDAENSVLIWTLAGLMIQTRRLDNGLDKPDTVPAS